MSAAKRISLTPLASSKKAKPCPKTHRFQLVLTESTEQSCPEFNFSDLLASVTKKKEGPAQNGHTPLDPYAEDDEDQLRAMAKKFEEKYGIVPTKSKKSKKKDECVDLGAGYDETDPFIDNTDAYDEVVPTDLTTAYGGFYINSGALEFKSAEEGSESESSSESSSESESESDSDAQSEQNERVGRKRRIIESDEDLSEPEVNGKEHQMEDAKKKVRTDEQTEVKILQSVEDPKVKKPKLVTNENERPKTDNDLPGPPKVADKQTSDSGSQSSDSSSSESSDSSSSSSESSSDEEDADEDKDKPSEKDASGGEKTTELPSLPPELLTLIEDVKKVATISEAGKCRFFSPEINSKLLKIELQSRQLSCSKRQAIYNYLENFLPCTKHTLLKRVKNLVMEEVEGQVKPAVKKLQAAVEKVMPEQIERHASECQHLAEANPDKYAEYYRCLWDPDLEPAGGTDDEGKKTEGPKNALPRRKFEWTPEIKSLLNKAVYLKAQCFQWSKARKESAEEYVSRFLDNEIKTLWPKGWISTKILWKECRETFELASDSKKLNQGSQRLAPLAASLTDVLPKPSGPAHPVQGPKAVAAAASSPVPRNPSAAAAAPSQSHKTAATAAQTPKTAATAPVPASKSSPALLQATPKPPTVTSAPSKDVKRVKDKNRSSSPSTSQTESGISKQQETRASETKAAKDPKTTAEPKEDNAGSRADFPEKPLLFIRTEESLKNPIKPDSNKPNLATKPPAAVVESGIVDLVDSPDKPAEALDVMSSKPAEEDVGDRELSLQRDLAQVMEVLTNFAGEPVADSGKKQQESSVPQARDSSEAAKAVRQSVISTSPAKVPSSSPKNSVPRFSSSSSQSSPSPEKKAPFPAHQQQSSLPPAMLQQHSKSRNSLMRNFSSPPGIVAASNSNSSSNSSSLSRTNSYHSIDSLAQTSRTVQDSFPPVLNRFSSSQHSTLQQQQQLPRFDPLFHNFPAVSKSSTTRSTPAPAHGGYGYFPQQGVVDGLADVSAMLHAAEFGVDLTFFQSSGSGHQHHS